MADIDITVALNDRASQQLRNLDRAAKGVTNTLRLAAGAAAAFATGAVVQGIVGQYRAYERYRTVLTTFLGTQDKANAELARLQKLADTLPQDLSDITQAFTVFSRFGIDTSAKSLTAFSNIATANGKSMSQLGEAVADALTGEFERLKEFGIKVSRENDGFVARIGEQQVAVATTSQDLMDQLKELGMEGGKFAGAAAANADTLNQSISNLQGAIFTTSVSIMEEFKPALRDVINDLSELLRNNQDVAKSIGGALKTALEGIVTVVKFAAENFEELKAVFVFFLARKAITIVATQMVALQTALNGVSVAAGITATALKAISRAFAPLAIISAVLAGATAAFLYFKDTQIRVGETTASLGQVTLATFNVIKTKSVEAFNKFRDVATESFNQAVSSGNNFANSIGIDIGGAFNAAVGFVRKFAVNSIAALGALVQFNIKNFKVIGEVVKAVFQNISDNWQTVVTFIKDLLDPLIQGIASAFKGVQEFIGQGFKAAVEDIKNFFTPIVDFFREILINIGDRVKSGLNFVINTFDFAFQTVKAIVMNIPTFFVDAFKGVLDVAQDFGEAIIKKFNNIFESLSLLKDFEFKKAFAKLGEDTGFSFQESFASSFQGVSLIPEGAVDKDAIFSQDRVGQTIKAAKDFTATVGEEIKSGLESALATSQAKIDEALNFATGDRIGLEDLKEKFKANFDEIATDFENNKDAINKAIDNINLGSFQELKASLVDMLPPEVAEQITAEILKMEKAIVGAKDKSVAAIEEELKAMEKARLEAIAAAKATEFYDDAILRMANSQKKANDAVKNTTDSIEEQGDTATKTAKTVSETLEDNINNLASSMSSTLTDAFLGIKNGFEALEDIALSVVKTIVNTLTQEFLVKPLLKEIAAAIGGAFGGTSAGGGLGSLLGGLGAIPGLGPFAALAGLGVFLGSRANGGPVSGNRPYMVGERGPELFVPKNNGQIIANEELNESGGQGALTVQFNINAIDTKTGTEFLLENKRVITGVVQDAFRRRAQAGPLG